MMISFRYSFKAKDDTVKDGFKACSDALKTAGLIGQDAYASGNASQGPNSLVWQGNMQFTPKDFSEYTLFRIRTVIVNTLNSIGSEAEVA